VAVVIAADAAVSRRTIAALDRADGTSVRPLVRAGAALTFAMGAA